MNSMKLKNLVARLNILCEEHNLRPVSEMVDMVSERSLEDDGPREWIERWSENLREYCFEYFCRHNDDDDDGEYKTIIIQQMVRSAANILKMRSGMEY